jgi:hypothetical protein
VVTTVAGALCALLVVRYVLPTNPLREGHDPEQLPAHEQLHLLEARAAREINTNIAIPTSSASPPQAETVRATAALYTAEAFAAETVDSTWSSGMESDILREIAETSGLNLVTVQVECKTTVCRLQVAQVGSPGREQPSVVLISDRLVSKFGLVLQPMIEFKQQTGIVYLTRSHDIASN